MQYVPKSDAYKGSVSVLSTRGVEPGNSTKICRLMIFHLCCSIYKWCGSCNTEKPNAYLSSIRWIPVQQQCRVCTGIRSPGRPSFLTQYYAEGQQVTVTVLSLWIINDDELGWWALADTQPYSPGSMAVCQLVFAIKNYCMYNHKPTVLL